MRWGLRDGNALLPSFEMKLRIQAISGDVGYRSIVSQ